MEDDTAVYVWDDRKHRWRALTAARLVCPECGRGYAEMWWEEVIRHEPHVACPCGEQFSTTAPEE